MLAREHDLSQTGMQRARITGFLRDLDQELLNAL